MRLLLEKLPLFGALGAAWCELRRSMTDPYRPELHYMRGPGPRAQAKRAGRR
jgi:hypothetical protein